MHHQKHCKIWRCVLASWLPHDGPRPRRSSKNRSVKQKKLGPSRSVEHNGAKRHQKECTRSLAKFLAVASEHPQEHGGPEIQTTFAAIEKMGRGSRSRNTFGRPDGRGRCHGQPSSRRAGNMTTTCSAVFPSTATARRGMIERELHATLCQAERRQETATLLLGSRARRTAVQRMTISNSRQNQRAPAPA